MNILSVYEEDGLLKGEIHELGKVVTASTMDELYSKVSTIVEYAISDNDNIKNEIISIDDQIAKLLARKSALEGQIADDPIVAAIIDERESQIYRSVLKVLTDDTGIEKAIGRSVVRVVFVPDDDGNIYNTRLGWIWYFGKYFEE